MIPTQLKMWAEIIQIQNQHISLHFALPSQLSYWPVGPKFGAHYRHCFQLGARSMNTLVTGLGTAAVQNKA